MEELLKAMVTDLVENKDALTITKDPPNAQDVVIYHLHVAPDDMGRIIGKQGRIAKAIRTIMRAAAIRQNEKIMVDIN